MALRNLCVTAGTLCAGGAWTALVAREGRRRGVACDTTRKIVHLTGAPVMLATWPLYAAAWHARVFAAGVPLAFALRMARGADRDPLCAAVSRSGDPAESRAGPAAYCAAVAAVILALWRADPAAYAAVGMLVVGDLAANVAGSALGGPRWPLKGSRKTLAGSAAFVLAGSAATKGFLAYAQATGACAVPVPWARVMAVAAASATVEVLPVQDNVSVPLAAAVAAKLVF